MDRRYSDVNCQEIDENSQQRSPMCGKTRLNSMYRKKKAKRKQLLSKLNSNNQAQIEESTPEHQITLEAIA